MEWEKIRGIYHKSRGIFRRIGRMDISGHASHTCFFLMLAVFPALTLVLGLLRYTHLEPADLMELAAGMLPDALEVYVWNLISGTYAHTSRLVVSVSAVTALWSAGRGVHGVMRGLNGVYGVEERRGWFHTRLVSMFYTFLFLMVLILTLVLNVFGNTLLELIRSAGIFVPRWVDLRFFLPVVVQTLVFDAMFMYLPGRQNGFRESLPGALFASLGWMLFSAGFSVYVENRYTNIYGSVYGVALGMLWLYMCVSIVFYGALLNRFLENPGEFVTFL